MSIELPAHTTTDPGHRRRTLPRRTVVNPAANEYTNDAEQTNEHTQAACRFIADSEHRIIEKTCECALVQRIVAASVAAVAAGNEHANKSLFSLVVERHRTPEHGVYFMGESASRLSCVSMVYGYIYILIIRYSYARRSPAQTFSHTNVVKHK